ncbi:MAG: NtrZ family periplasmic regulatory protein [Pseudomonadota bacterium]
MRGLCFLTSFLLVAPGLAAADEDDSFVELSAPSASETQDAKPDWYRQFTLSSPDGDQPLWRGVPERDYGLQWDKGDDWSLRLDITTRPEDSPLPREEMKAGATLRITPRFSIGGEVSVGADSLDGGNIEEQQVETGIRLQSAFKF